MIKGVRFNLADRVLEIDTDGYEDPELLKEDIKKRFHFVREIVVKAPRVLYSSLDECLKCQWGQLLNKLLYKYPIMKEFIKGDYRIVDDKLLITICSRFGLEFVKKKGIDKFISAVLYNYTGSLVKVEFELNESEVVLDNPDIFVELPKKEEKKAQPKQTDDMLILGKPIKNSPIPINQISEEYDEAVIAGNIFDIEERPLKTGKSLLTLKVTDYTDSLYVKMFLDEKNMLVKEKLKKGCWYKFKGFIRYDNFVRDTVMICNDVEIFAYKERVDNAAEKRVELHLHTRMSSMDGVNSAEDLIKRAAQWGHKAIAITDHGVVQAYPEAADAAKKYGIKVIYGIEAYIYDDGIPVVYGSTDDRTLDSEFVVLDIETTGLNSRKDCITEIGAVKIRGKEIVDRFSTFVNPGVKIPDNIVKLTGITDDMVKDAPSVEQVMKEFKAFVGKAVLVAHNAEFDITFIKGKAQMSGIQFDNPVLDTLQLARGMFPDLKNHKLDTVAEFLNVDLKNHHRAVDDAQATADIFIKCLKILQDNGISTLKELNDYFLGKVNNKNESYHAVILVKNMVGLRNLYKLVSKSHLEHYYRKPRIPKSLLNEYREGLILGSACEAGELYRGIINGLDEKKLMRIAQFYDYLEIMPVGNNKFMVKKQIVQSEDNLREINKKIYELGKKLKKIVVATGDVHFLDPQDEVARRILMYGSGFDDADDQAPLYFKTTEEMLEEFSYLGPDIAKEVVIENTNKIADMVEVIKPIPDETYTPKIPGAEEELWEMVMKKAHQIYGDPLPEIVEKRLKRELDSIINHGYAVLYIIAQRLVKKSNDDGYLVGSRGSVGSSLVATMSGITEVNPLPPHYVCPQCKYSEFFTDGSVGSGPDLEDKNCPVCGTLLKKDGFDIPFEVFLGFDGDKEPDIDLNFSGEYQPIAHKYTEELFGKGHVFRAGTIGTLADKTAYGFVKKYIDEHNLKVHAPEVDRLVQACTGVKRTTGQHPGGLMVVPKDNEIYEFTPIQHPADDSSSSVITTHFDYHSLSGRLLKLDILGHDDPTVIRMLEDLTGVDARSIPLDDKDTMRLFTSTEPLGIKPEDIDCEVGTLALPEFGTKFVRQMLVDTQPTTFAELIRISGLSHGTDVWLNNAQDLIRDGIATLKEVICTRDDIMLYLLQKGVEPKLSFKIMENVRKGKGLTDEDIAAMKAKDVPDWFIQSCQKIKYMFPKAHAAAYVMMAFRIAYFKVHYPKEFYATYFTVRADDFDADIVVKGEEEIRRVISQLNNKGNEMTPKEKNMLTILEVALEMYMRGIKLYPVDIYESDAVKFIVKEDGLLAPLNSLAGLGLAAAQNIVKARSEGRFVSIEDLRERAKLSRNVIEILMKHGCLKGMPETSQLSLFDNIYK
ncbi:DNA polymerase-3 subunit alpha [Caldanaerobius fijiensis DSM 17918]|uniref:DNA polymerase III PolC-type n=1 Tax=Caldanaerobius fijiensis DSM 17918 TaxID=1121256 RepID=A0A1M4XHN0_9THEO|nr:PolC-type DNA polymerase III [Caldanaerobius fijiensis]SHE93187.1 DNA polymerase-3 subunit alpha [Caldanaerobius fijiensis DSM 17918]